MTLRMGFLNALRDAKIGIDLAIEFDQRLIDLRRFPREHREPVALLASAQ